MSKRIAVLVSSNYQDHAYCLPVEAFRAARHSICNIEHHAGKIVYGSELRSHVTIDRELTQTRVDDFDALLIPGGESALWFSQDPHALAFIRAFNDAQKQIFSLDDASLLLASADILNNRMITSIRDHYPHLRDRGAKYYDAELVNDNNQIISSRAPADLNIFIHECLQVLRS
ncbi:peptidase [Acinetobacter sp. NCu2D-2]|uniref:DJ-1/PfpI family protein n=1 Tax=Acinetobacter sp. NCu2D-2 TaxID=1608473 RepID=UPI0007CDEFBB|nr:DJ-1/PfpI family protein [Acinetobacter sp. NCu2D-2]ANF82076.1 peptidase [Acinetobacter sp. NCu2D-2]